MRRIEFRLDGDRLSNSAAPHARRVTDADREQFADWIKAYRAAAWRTDNADTLLDLGRQIYAWLDRDGGWMAALRQTQGSPVVAEFATRALPDAPDRQFLEVPWELAAAGEDFLAADATMMWAPLRRIGKRGEPQPPDHRHRLGVMFMAAAPRGENRLDFEAEEAEILRATARTGIDLFVEDTGNLDELSTAWDQVGTLDALHLSCHGMGGEDACLALEDEAGDLKRATLPDIAGGFVHRRPRLLFLSACHTGEGDAEVDSLALGLVQADFASVLGWADAVFDSDASAFAADFYRQAARPGMSVEEAWAAARFSLLGPRPIGRRPRHWHLARLFLGTQGGGKLTDGSARRVTTDVDAGRKAVIRARGGQIEVANRFEFVGRREQVQAILREFRQPEHAGVLIHGFGRQGKSSLAARIMDRRPHLAQVVLFQRCDGPSLLAEIAERIPATASLCQQYQAQVDPNRTDIYDPDALYRALRELLTGPCGSAHGGTPMLLVLDDFEALLDPPSGDGHWQVKPAAEAPLSAIIRAFDAGGTDSRLLLTCRYQFPFRDRRGRNLAVRLLPVHLPAMSKADTVKQARQKIFAGDPRQRSLWRTEMIEFAVRVYEVVQGNAGFQDVIFQAALSDFEAGQATLDAMRGFLSGGSLPRQPLLREPLEELEIHKLVNPLTESERTLLRAPTLFDTPLPRTLWKRFADQAGLGGLDRLFEFGLWEPPAEGIGPVGANSIIVRRMPTLTEEQAKTIVILMSHHRNSPEDSKQ